MKPKTDKNGTMTAKFSAADVHLWHKMRVSLKDLEVIERDTQMAARVDLLRLGLEAILAERVPGMAALFATAAGETDAD